MPVLRLFAAAREAAGTALDEVPGQTVGEVLDGARARYGPDFDAVLAVSRVWCNGEPASEETPVGSGDEVAVLPPVSGGAGADRGEGASAGDILTRTQALPGTPPPPVARSRSKGSRRPDRPPRSGSSDRAGRGDRPARSGGSGDPGRTGPAGDTARRRLRSLRTVKVPVTGEVTVRGRPRPVSGPRPRRTALGRRYGVVYDTDGWKVTSGIAWFVATMLTLYLGWAPLALLYGVAAGWAALEATERWREVGVRASEWVAALGAGAIAASAAAGARWVGATLLVVVALTVALSALGPSRHRVERERALGAVGLTVQSAMAFGLPAACVVLTRDLSIGAAVVLVLFVSAYDVGDFLIGSGSSNGIEGPVTGMVTIGVTATAVAVLLVPPYRGAPAFAFAALAALACPLGQLLGSALLPAADAAAPAVRRLDSLLLLAPAWVWATGLFMENAL